MILCINLIIFLNVNFCVMWIVYLCVFIIFLILSVLIIKILKVNKIKKESKRSLRNEMSEAFMEMKQKKVDAILTKSGKILIKRNPNKNKIPIEIKKLILQRTRKEKIKKLFNESGEEDKNTIYYIK